MTDNKVLIIIPAYNESGNIKKTVDEVKSLGEEYDILVVNDGSTDDTAEAVKETKAGLITLPLNLGIGGAVQTGLLYAQRNQYDFAVQIDGDGQHDPKYLKDLLDPLYDDKADLVIGSRFVDRNAGYRSSFVRRIGIHFFARLISFLTRARITDPTSGFRGFNRQTIHAFAGDYPGDYPEPESIVVARRLGLRVMEVSVSMRERTSGVSSIRYLLTLYYMCKVTFAIMMNMLRQKKGR